MRILIVALTLLTPLHAAEFSTEPATCADGTKGCVDVHLNGKIVAGDAARFAKVVAKIPKGQATIYLNSYGGDFRSGLAIARRIRNADFSTYVDTNSYCESMCGIIWLAGDVRYLSRAGHVGFHTISHEVGKRRVRYEAANAVLLSFYRDIGISAKAGGILIKPEPGDMTFLTPALITDLDIKLTWWPEKPTVTGVTAAWDRQAALVGTR